MAGCAEMMTMSCVHPRLLVTVKVDFGQWHPLRMAEWFRVHRVYRVHRVCGVYRVS